jgi:hypothetical protein
VRAHLLVSAILAAGTPLWAASLRTTDDGLLIDAGSMGRFTLSYPTLLGERDDQAFKPIQHEATGERAVVSYEGGGRIELSVQADGVVLLQLADLPASARKLRMDMLIDFSFSEGGSWQIGNTSPTPFPKEKPAKPHLYQGNETVLRLTNFEGKVLTFEVPSYSYQQLQDNREWNWKIFAWMFIAPLDPGVPRLSVRITEGEAAGGAKRVVVVDRFGQDALLDFPDKVKSEEELREDVARDNAYYGALQPPPRDTYGGLPDSGARLGLRRTGFFQSMSQPQWKVEAVLVSWLATRPSPAEG